MLKLKENPKDILNFSVPKLEDLNLESTLEDLKLYSTNIDYSLFAEEAILKFKQDSRLPGLILSKEGEFKGMVSRREFLEQMSRPYGLELFSRRPLARLYAFVKTKMLVLPGNTLIVAAADQALKRSGKLLDEPIVVKVAPNDYRLLDIHQLLVAHSQIYQLTHQLLQKQTQEKILQTEKLASLGRMMAGIAHEIRNPVNCINGNCSFLDNYYQDLVDLVAAYDEELQRKPEHIIQLEENIELAFLKEDLPKILKTVKVASEQLIAIVGGLRNFSHMDNDKTQLVNIQACLDSTLLILKNRLKKGVTISKNYQSIPELSAYSGLLSQVFINLITNALDALEEKQTQSLEDWQPQITITTKMVEANQEKFILVSILDNALGMPLEIEERIFETFFTTKTASKGTGLGLAICHQIVTEKHQGKLNVNSCLGKGTEFEVILPLKVIC